MPVGAEAQPPDRLAVEGDPPVGRASKVAEVVEADRAGERHPVDEAGLIDIPGEIPRGDRCRFRKWRTQLASPPQKPGIVFPINRRLALTASSDMASRSYPNGARRMGVPSLTTLAGALASAIPQRPLLFSERGSWTVVYSTVDAKRRACPRAALHSLVVGVGPGPATKPIQEGVVPR